LTEAGSESSRAPFGVRGYVAANVSRAIGARPGKHLLAAPEREPERPLRLRARRLQDSKRFHDDGRAIGVGAGRSERMLYEHLGIVEVVE
jgi:hypothetical protein